MIRLSLNLPQKYRLDLHLVKGRKRIDDNQPLLPNLGKIRRTRSGNKISRYFRHIFENVKVKKFFGANLIVITLASSFVPNKHPFVQEIQEATTTQAPIIFETEAGIQNPLDSMRMTQGYKFYHPGIDLDGITGDKIKPIMSGVVAGVGYSRFGYGNAILINHGSGMVSLYAHLSKIYVVVGEDVGLQSIIGEMGTSGRAFGDHLHLEIYENGKPVNPLSVLP